MKSRLWFCLVLFVAGCMPEPQSSNTWDGTYIGYYHRNQQDTVPVTLTFEGKYFAAAPRNDSGSGQLSGVFRQRESALIFYCPDGDSTAVLQGTFQYQQGLDGSYRIWRYPDNGGIVEVILRQQ